MRSTLAIVLATALAFAITTTVSAQKGQGGGPKVKTTSAPKAQGGGSKAQGGGSKAQGGPKATTSSTTTTRAHGGGPKKTTTTTTTTTASAKNPKKSGSSTSVASTSTSTPTSTSTTTTGGTTVTLSPVQQKLQKNTNLAKKLEGRLGGLDLMTAAEGFPTLGKFVSTVNASYNHDLSFADLKTRILDDGMSLGQAMKAERGELADTTTLARRAETEANQLIASTEASTTTSSTSTTTNTSTKKTKKSGGQ
jgi:hypothetical protein